MEGYLTEGNVNLRNVALWLTSKGLLHLHTGDSESPPYPTSITLLPTPLQHKEYLNITELQPHINLIMDRMSLDYSFVVDNMATVARHDPFCKGFLDIYKAVHDKKNRITLGLHRHDFMYQTPDPCSSTATVEGEFKMIEMNFTAASLGSLSEGVAQYHQTVTSRLQGSPNKREPINNIQGFADGLSSAYHAYIRLHEPDRDCVVVLLEADRYCFNYFDQQLLLNAVEAGGIRTVRYTTQELVEHGTVQDGRYLIHDTEVAVFYFRTLYDPEHFNDAAWDERRRIELCRAVTVPPVRHQIVNMKLFQMLLCNRAVISRYTDSATIITQLLNVLGTVLPLTLDKEGDSNAQLGLDNPSMYVLKPQREGGGNNYWDDEMVEMLTLLSGDPSRAQYILMRKITPPVIRNRFIKHGRDMSPVVDTVSEVGWYSTYLTVDSKVVLNKVVGTLIRTKHVTSKEGGLAVGMSCIDSAVFI